jgi:hypothetical protein
VTKTDETVTLWQLLAIRHEMSVIWTTGRTDASRERMVQQWDIAITAPGSRDSTDEAQSTSRCTPTVLTRDTRTRAGNWQDGELWYRGACLGCGWVSEAVHDFGNHGENGAAEDANDHAYPRWRGLPIVARPPTPDGGTPYQRAVAKWRERWDPVLPPGWLDEGGPIRTERAKYATRHVPGGAPGGGYDMAVIRPEGEAAGGQMALFS